MSTRSVVLIVVLVASLVVLAAVVRWQPVEPGPSGPATGLKVIVVGVDGLDWFLVARLLEAEALPSMAGLRRRGLMGEVAADTPVRPQHGWTVLGRGRGLSDEERARAMDGSLRGRTPELARLVVDAGGAAVTVGWPASWPAASGAGTVVASYAPAAPVHEAAVPAAVLRGGTGQVSSDDLVARIDAIVERNEEILQDEFSRRIFEGSVDAEWREHMTVARWAFLSDLVTADLAAALLAAEEPDLGLVCFGGLDALGHRFLAPAMPEYFAEGPASSERYADVLVNYYRFIDDAIERLRRLADEHTVFILCSTYGTHPSGDTPGYSGAHTNGPPGVLMCEGPRLAQRQAPLSLTTLDLAPTVLALLGMDIPTGADGRVVLEMLPRGHIENHPLTYAESAGAEAVEPSTEDISGMDALVRRRLEALEP